MISGSTEIAPGWWGGVTFQEIAIVCIQSDFGPGFLNTFSCILSPHGWDPGG